MAKSSTRRVAIYINGKEVEAFVIFGFFVFSPPPKPPPMNRHRPYHLMNPLTGIWPAYGNALGYRYASPGGDCRSHETSTTHSVAHPSSDHSSLITAHSSHTFSAKEKDSETGLSYFGARYYSSDLSIWLSVDPMSDKYPSLSPYVYCANNPVKLVDPNGEKIKPVNATSKQYLNSYLQDQFGTSNFISYSKNDIVKIDRKAFRTLYANANPYQKVLLNGFKKVVNSRSMVYVDIDNKKKFDYSYPVYTITKDSEFPTYSHDVVGYHIIESGTTVESHDGYFIYINNEGAIADRMISSLPFEDNQSSLSFTGGSASSIFFHELLDEVLNYHIKHKTNDLSRKREKVFYENNALENKGLKPRNGIDHQ